MTQGQIIVKNGVVAIKIFNEKGEVIFYKQLDSTISRLLAAQIIKCDNETYIT